MSVLDRAVLDTRRPEFREWYALAANGGRMSDWLDPRVAPDVTACDVEALLALSGREHAVAAARAPGGEALSIGFALAAALSWEQVVRILAAAGPRTTGPDPLRLPTLRLHVRAPVSESEEAGLATATSGSCPYPPAW